MKRKIFARCIAPGFGQIETVSEHIDTLLDFAQFYDYPDFHLLAQTLDVIEKEFKNTLCIDLPDEVQSFLDELQSNIIAHAYGRINNEERFLNNIVAVARKIREHPEQTVNYDRALAGDVVSDSFENMFQEEVGDYFLYQRIIAKIIWRFDNWFGDKVAAIYSSFMGDMIAEVNYWKMARQVSVARAFG